jgi:hypothetical protein
LSEELRTILLDGPWAIGKTLRDLPPHDELRAVWAVHGPALLASRPRRRRPWFLGRDWFVKLIRGEE